ncbi:universal stress protein [Saccharopolyspora erythraea]|uniref:universal stress protein n=1 Tax=Saccharopolyspora erythraea TaxID=1836 RepID=UPI001E4A2FC1|nr:universal stress protein [Saccharopolyspora erythraea]
MSGDGLLVVGVDGSDASSRALRWALAEARRRSTSVLAIMAWESHAVMSGPAPMLLRPEMAPHEIHNRRREELARVVREARAGAANPEVQAELVEGSAAEVLVDNSADAAMLVLGDRGHGRFGGALGSTALKCAHKARCPVVIVPAGVELDDDDVGRGEEQIINDPVLG